MVQTQYDGATPLNGALATFSSLPNASMIYVTNDYSHGTFPYRTACVDGNIADYLLTGAVPAESLHTCIGRSILQPQQILSGENALQNNEFTNPELAAKIEQEISDDEDGVKDSR